MCMDLFPAIYCNGPGLMLGDTIKVSKETGKMPGIKTLPKQSENSWKPDFIREHPLGFVGLLVGSIVKALFVPQQFQASSAL